MKKRKLITIAICLLLPALASCSLLEEKGITANNEQSQLKETEQKAIVQKIANNYYYQQLNKKQQDNYIKLYQSLSQFREVISLSSQSKKSLIKTIDAFVMDNPEFFWITSADYHFEISDYDAYVTFPIPKDIKTTYQKLQSTADEIVSKMPQGSDYDKVKYFYEVIVQQTDYNKKAFEAYQSGDSSKIASNQDIRSVFLNHLSVCNGYAQAFQLLCQKAGIPVAYIRGTVTSHQTQGSYPHAWNTIMLDGKWYAVDTTWGDPVFDSQLSGNPHTDTNYHFLCLPDSLMNLSHHASSDIDFNHTETYQNVWKMPVCSDDSLLYAKQHQSYFDTYDTNQVLDSVANQLAKSQTPITIQFSNQEAYEDMVRDLATNQEQYHHLFSSYQDHYSGYTYSQVPEVYAISFNTQTA
ncbi:transglutaminase domain-containing protein [Streptococcus ictaluri]|uniref:Transglutaminase-like protein n=1 Tax=Streptococcus ictaluri 707-05 TaxID=764299 RepID=G5JZI7_9STRE|nr:transglutaminase domain-containing protein [Streptococcus ictaluri]EHI70723.1 transglutaminase-like protein [Streptococcus ictaluri 707-05]